MGGWEIAIMMRLRCQERETMGYQRSSEEIELATDIYMQLHKLGMESLLNLKASVDSEIERKRTAPRATKIKQQRFIASRSEESPNESAGHPRRSR